MKRTLITLFTCAVLGMPAMALEKHTTTTSAGYDIEIRNWTKKDISNIEVRYTIFHRKDAENGPGSIAQTKGTFFVSTLFAGKDDPNRTDAVNLIRYSRKKSGGG